MTPTRETIARAIYQDIELHGRGSGYVGGDSDLSDVCIDANCDLLSAADAVLRALDEAGPVVVPKEASTAMILATLGKVEINWHCAGRRSDYDLCETAFEPACLPDIYRAMIAAAPDGGPA